MLNLKDIRAEKASDFHVDQTKKPVCAWECINHVTIGQEIQAMGGAI